MAVNIFVNGKHHVSFGGTCRQATPDGEQTRELGPVETAAGPLVMSLTASAFTYEIAPYPWGDIDCSRVIYSGKRVSVVGQEVARGSCAVLDLCPPDRKELLLRRQMPLVCLDDVRWRPGG